MKLQIKVDDDENIVDAKFKTFGCLASNALICTPNNYKKISELNLGEYVYAWNGTKIVKNKIKEIFTTEYHIKDLVKIKFNHTSKSVICSKDHVWWSVKNKPILAEDLNIGDELMEMTENELRILNNVRHKDWFKQKLSKRMIQFNKTFDHSVLPQNQKGFKHSEEYKQNHSIASLKKWQNLEYRKNWEKGMAGANNVRPTSLEKKFIELFEQNNIDARYVGNGEFWAGTSHLNPDFKVNRQRKVIEVYDSNMPSFMMDRKSNKWIIDRKKKFLNAGFKSLFIDIHNIKNCVKEVQTFIHNGIKIENINQITDKRQLKGVEKSSSDTVILYDLKLEEGANIYFVKRVMSHNCGSAIASSSLATEWVKGKSIDEAHSIRNTEIVEELSLPPVKIHCSVLAEDAIKGAIDDYRKKNGIVR